MLYQGDLVAASIYDKYSGSMKIATNLDYTSHCKTALVRLVELIDRFARIDHKYSPRFDEGLGGTDWGLGAGGECSWSGFREQD